MPSSAADIAPFLNGVKATSLPASRLQAMADLARQVLDMENRPIRLVLLDSGFNAYAYQRRGEDMIALDTNCLRSLWAYARSAWPVMGVVAHEIGHHYFHHPTHPMEPHLQEQSADYIAGYVLGRLGAPADAGDQLLQFLADPYHTPSHPGRASRQRAMRLGWEAGQKAAEPNPEQEGG